MIEVHRHTARIQHHMINNHVGDALTRRECVRKDNVIHFTKSRSRESYVNNTPVTHEDLVLRIAQNKDKGAFKEIFVYFAPRLKSYLMTLGLDAQKAEGVTQEVLIILWNKADKFDPQKAKLSTWLFRVARNKFIDHTRKCKYPEVNADDHLSDMVAADKTDEYTENKQTSERIKKAMHSLKPDQKQVIELSFFNEMSHSQIADHLQLPLGTVKSRIRLAFTILRNELGDMQ